MVVATHNNTKIMVLLWRGSSADIAVNGFLSTNTFLKNNCEYFSQIWKIQ
jgi:hypothetical protein